MNEHMTFRDCRTFGGRRRRLHFILDLLVDEHGPEAVLRIMKDWREDYDINRRAMQDVEG